MLKRAIVLRAGSLGVAPHTSLGWEGMSWALVPQCGAHSRAEDLGVE